MRSRGCFWIRPFDDGLAIFAQHAPSGVWRISRFRLTGQLRRRNMDHPLAQRTGRIHYRSNTHTHTHTLLAPPVVILALVCAEAPLRAQPSVLTSQYGNMRQSYNSQESVLVSSSVKNIIQPAAFPTTGGSTGPVLTIDKAPNGSTNQVFAQPLYVPGVPTAITGCNPSCNMLVVAALGGGIYAFNAGDTTHTGGTYAGRPIWSRNTETPSTGIGKTNYLWYDDCGGTGLNPAPSAPPYGIPFGVPFAGIVSTPVIDTGGGAYVMYVTSLCETNTGSGNQQWYIHKIDLTTGYDVTGVTPQEIAGYSFGSYKPDDFTNANPICPNGHSCISFIAWETLQRSALLEAPIPPVSGVNPLIYVPFGFGEQYEDSQTYHGWLFAYDSSLNRQFSFATTTAGPSNGTTNNPNWPACNFNCSCTGTSCTGIGTTCVASSGTQSYQGSYNFCGHAAGVWMSGRGGAAATDSESISHAYFGVGNGSFQQNLNGSGGSLLDPIPNWSQSVVDFTLSAITFDQGPSEYFTPYSRPVQKQLLGQGGFNPVSYTFEGLNQNDFDMAVGGILLFDDLNQKHRLVTVDKAGYGYLLRRGNLCGAPAGTGCYPNYLTGNPGFSPGDPGSLFTFGANLTQCTDLTPPDQCHRITSLAFYPDGSPNQYLYFWPHGETLTALQLSDNTNQNGNGLVSSTGGTTLSGAACSASCPCSSGSCFKSTVIPGDAITAGGQTQTVVQVVSGTQVTVAAPGFSPDVSGASWQYAGYFIKPLRDTAVAANSIFYPGASSAVTSNSGSGGVVWGLATVGVNGTPEGSLYAYDAESLSLLWCNNTSGSPCDSSSSFTAPRFALPTIANGYVYIPTAGITSMAGSSCTAGSPCSGVAVYSGH